MHSFYLESSNSTTINFKNSTFHTDSLILICKGDEEYVTRMTSKLEDRFSAMKPWYGLIAKSGWLILLLLSWIPSISQLVGGYQSSYTLSSLLHDIINTPFPKLTVGFILTLIILAIGVFLFAQLSRLWNFVFPMGAFAIGQGTKRHKNRELLRTLVVIGFGINLLAGLIILFMSSK